MAVKQRKEQQAVPSVMDIRTVNLEEPARPTQLFTSIKYEDIPECEV